MDTKSSQEDIFLIALDGGPEIPLVEHAADDDVMGWLPDGKRFLFRSDRRGKGDDIWMIQVEDGKPLGAPRLVKTGLRGSQGYPKGLVRTPTGGWAFYYRERGRLKGICSTYLGALDPDTGKLLTAPKPIPQPTAERERAFSPDFSRDGKCLTYYVTPAGEWTSKGWRNDPGKIVIRSLETGQERELTLSPKLSHKNGAPRLRWAPDGRSILVQGRIETGQGGIFRADVETGKVTTVVTAGPEPTEASSREYCYSYYAHHRIAHDYATFPEWSADGKTVFFIRGDTDPSAPQNRRLTRRFMAYDLETGRERVIYRDPEGWVHDFDPAVSPDGQRVVIGDKKSFAILPTTGGEPRDLVKFEGDRSSFWSTGWTPDSRHVLYVKFDGPKSELWRVAADGGEPERLGNLSGGLPIAVSQVRMHPDGRQIAFHAIRRVKQYRIRMLQIVGFDELAKEMCAANLRRIGTAIEQYKNDHGDVPDGFADLYPEYLQDSSVLVCPDDRTGGKPLEEAKDPEMRCSYAYRFGPGTEGVLGVNVPLPVDFPAREGMTWKDAGKLQVEYYGGMVPIVRCRHHSPWLGYDGEVYESEKYWVRSPQAKAGLLSQLELAMQSEPATWAQRYNMQRFACDLFDEPALTKFLKTHLKDHPEDQAAREFLAELPRLRFLYDGGDDAEEDVDDGSISPASWYLQLIHDADDDEDQVVGIRFPDIPVPQGARIKRAYVQFTAWYENPGSEKTDLVLHAELAANAKPFAMVKHNITSRRKTAASVKWSPQPWTVGGERSEKQRTPDLSALIQEVVNQPDWKKGNFLALIISGSGCRSADSWDGSWSGDPMLYVEH